MTSKLRMAMGVFSGLVVPLTLALASRASAATYQVGPARTLKRLQDIAGTLKPGDIVELDGNATYTGGVILDQSGTAALPITVRGMRVGGVRPILSGGTNTIEVQGAYTVVEGLDITAGTSRCFYHHADHVTVRDTVIHDCPAQGLLGADNDSGSLLAEYIEVHHCGQGTQNHQIYMSTDPTTFPGAVFRLQHSYIHDGVGGNNVKSRAQRNEIYYNWIEGAYYHELELIGPDVGAGVVTAGQFRYDSEVVGNVLRKRGGANFWIVRFGGDLLENSSNGRYRFTSNTVVTEAGDPGVFRLHFGLESLEADDNVFYAIGGVAQTMIRDTEANWVGGIRRVTGVNNWLTNAQFAASVEWTGTLTGTDPGFANFAANDLHPIQSSPLVNHGTTTTAGYSGYALPNPLAVAQYEPPLRSAENAASVKTRTVVGELDIGAYEFGAPGLGGSGGQGSGGVSNTTGGVAQGGISNTTGRGGSAGTGQGGISNTTGGGSAGMGQGGVSNTAGGGAGTGQGGASNTTGGQIAASQSTGGQTVAGATQNAAGRSMIQPNTGGMSAVAGGAAGMGGAVSTNETSTDSSGCGCRTTRSVPVRGLPLLVLLGLGMVSRRRRCRGNFTHGARTKVKG